MVAASSCEPAKWNWKNIESIQVGNAGFRVGRIKLNELLTR